LHEYRILNFVHTFINNKEKLPVIFESYFVQNKCIHSYDTRTKCDLHLRSIQLMVARKPIAKGCSLWNKLPHNIKPITSNKTFRIRLKKYYLQSIYTVGHKKWCHFYFYDNFGKCGPISIILSVLDSQINCGIRYSKIFHRT